MGICVKARSIAYVGDGLGKMLGAGGTAVTARLDVKGTTETATSSSFLANGGTFGEGLTAFDYQTRTMIDLTSFSILQGNLLGGDDLRISGAGAGTINSAPATLAFAASKIGGVVTLQIQNVTTNEILVSATGEAGRSDLQLLLSSAH